MAFEGRVSGTVRVCPGGAVILEHIRLTSTCSRSSGLRLRFLHPYNDSHVHGRKAVSRSFHPPHLPRAPHHAPKRRRISTLTVPYYPSAVVGFVRSLGKILPEEKITLNAVCPNKIRTNISTEAVYKKAEEKGVLVPMEKLLQAFEQLLGASDYSGECFEIAPKIGCRIVPPTPFVNDESRISAEMTYERSHYLHEPIDD
jgi:hypothetical protein